MQPVIPSGVLVQGIKTSVKRIFENKNPNGQVDDRGEVVLKSTRGMLRK
jgi:hypothetical protein